MTALCIQSATASFVRTTDLARLNEQKGFCQLGNPDVQGAACDQACDCSKWRLRCASIAPCASGVFCCGPRQGKLETEPTGSLCTLWSTAQVVSLTQQRLGCQRWTWQQYVRQKQRLFKMCKMFPAPPVVSACQISCSTRPGYSRVDTASGEHPFNCWALIDSALTGLPLTPGRLCCSLECIRQWSRSSPEPRCPLCNASFSVLVHSGTEEVRTSVFVRCINI